MVRIYIEVPKQIANVSQRNDIPTRWRWWQDDQVTTRCLVSTHVISFTIGSKQMVRMIRFISHACLAKLPCHFHVFAYLHLPGFVRQLPYVLCNLQISSLSYAGALERVPRSAHNYIWPIVLHGISRFIAMRSIVIMLTDCVLSDTSLINIDAGSHVQANVVYGNSQLNRISH